MGNKLFFIIFMLLWLGPIIGGVIVAKKKNRSPHWFWLGIWPGVGFWVFIIFLFLKPLEICENCKKKIPSGAKVCPYCTKETALSTRSKEEIDELKKNQTIKDYLGNDYKQTGMMSGSISSSGDSSGKATFSYKIKGKNGISIVYIDAYKENGIWNYNKINFYKERKSSDVINLLGEN